MVFADQCRSCLCCSMVPGTICFGWRYLLLRYGCSGLCGLCLISFGRFGNADAVVSAVLVMATLMFATAAAVSVCSFSSLAAHP